MENPPPNSGQLIEYALKGFTEVRTAADANHRGVVDTIRRKRQNIVIERMILGEDREGDMLRFTYPIPQVPGMSDLELLEAMQDDDEFGDDVDIEADVLFDVEDL